MLQRVPIVLILLAVLLAAAVAARLFIGGLGDTPEQTRALLELRAARIVAALLVGASLAAAGVLLQSLLRNPLASPDLLGLASGSGLGVMLAVYAAYLSGMGILGVDSAMATPAAIAGGLGALALVYLFAQRKGLLDPISLVLVGVVVGIIASAGMTLLRHLMPDQGVAAARLLAGALRDDVTPAQLTLVGLITAAAMGASLWASPAMDAASLQDDEARSLGVNLSVLRAILFTASGVLTAASVVLAGPIGFVGLICPHLVRLLIGPRHRPLLIGAAITGAALLIGADAVVALLRQAFPAVGRIPINVLTSLLGGPLLIILIRQAHRPN